MILSRRQFLTYTSIGLLTPINGWAASSNLQKQLNWLIKRQRRQGILSSHEHTAWSVYDFRTRKKLVSINEDRSMQAASMIKLFVALAYFYLHNKAPHSHPYGQMQQAVMEKMLVHSNNSATNLIIRWCRGPRNVAYLCQKATAGRFRQLHIVEYIPKNGRTYKNAASAHDYSRFFYDLWFDKLPNSSELKRLLSIKNHDRITTDIMSHKVTIYDKTGSTGMLCGDAGIVQMNTRNAYTFIGMIQRHRKAKYYSSWITQRSQAMREASSLIYQFMKSYHR